MIASVKDCSAILDLINRSYGIKGHKMYLHRSSGGKIYFIESSGMKTVFKLYRNIHNQDALQTIDIVTHLSRHGYPVVPIWRTNQGESYITIDIQGEENCVGILFKFIEGVSSFPLKSINEGNMLEIYPDLRLLGQQVGKLHRLMKNFEDRLLSRDKRYYIDRFTSLLRRDSYDEKKVIELEQYGEVLWNSIQKLPIGFCHGDIHTGNMIRTPNKDYVILDWDMAARSHSVIDVSIMCDATDFNTFAERSYDDTSRMLEIFNTGYSKERSLSDEEVYALYDFIAIRHYDLIATIVITNQENIMHDFIDEQFDWLMRWSALCGKKRMG